MTKITSTKSHDRLQELVNNFMKKSEVKGEIDKEVLSIATSLFETLKERHSNNISNQWKGKFTFDMLTNMDRNQNNPEPFSQNIYNFWTSCGFDTDMSNSPCPKRVFRRACFRSIMDTIQTKVQAFNFIDKFGEQAAMQVAMQVAIDRQDSGYVGGGETYRNISLATQICLPGLGSVITILATQNVFPSSGKTKFTITATKSSGTEKNLGKIAV